MADKERVVMTLFKKVSKHFDEDEKLYYFSECKALDGERLELLNDVKMLKEHVDNMYRELRLTKFRKDTCKD
jgi:hypothetical protein